MRDNFSAAHGLTAGNSAIERTERKTPFGGHLTGSEMRFASNGNIQRNAVRSLVASRLSDWEGCPTKGRFSCSRTPRDSSAPHPGGSEENGIGICESSSQRGNYREIIRLARRNHKPGGADLAGSVHVVRSLSG